jgi:DNA repair protein RadC
VKPGRKLVEMGAESCTDSDLLAILIGSGGRGFSAENVARELINRFGTLSGMMGVPLKELAKVRGVGPVKAIRLAAAYELTCRIVKHLEHNG